VIAKTVPYAPCKMAMTYLEQRLPPLGTTFLQFPQHSLDCRLVVEQSPALENFGPSALRRRHSIGGYIPHGLKAQLGSELTPNVGVSNKDASCKLGQLPTGCDTNDGDDTIDDAIGWPDTDDESQHQSEDEAATTPRRANNQNVPLQLSRYIDEAVVAREEDTMMRNGPSKIGARATVNSRMAIVGRPALPTPPASTSHCSSNGPLTLPLANVTLGTSLRCVGGAAMPLSTSPQGSPNPSVSFRTSPAYPSMGAIGRSPHNGNMCVSGNTPVNFSPVSSKPTEAIMTQHPTEACMDSFGLEMGTPSNRVSGGTVGDVAAGGQQGITTFMIRNVPLDVTQADLLERLDASGFADLYDFVYMPSSFDQLENKGYAFVNFCSVAVAGAFVGAWHKNRPWGMRGGQQLNISPAAIQGLHANVKKWAGARMKRIRNPALRPYVNPSMLGEDALLTENWRGQVSSSKSRAFEKDGCDMQVHAYQPFDAHHNMQQCVGEMQEPMMT